MTDFAVRALTEDRDLRAAQAVTAVALHRQPFNDAKWADSRGGYVPARYFGAVSDAGIVGTTYVFDSAVVVPGGNLAPMAGVSRVGVRPDWRRRGVLTELMRYQLADARTRGQILSGLHASETGIYGRFGYGIATQYREFTFRGARVRPDLRPFGLLRPWNAQQVVEQLPALHQRVGLRRPGAMTRGDDWWSSQVARRMRGDEPYQVYVHSGPDGDDGYVLFEVDSGADHVGRIRLWDLHATTPEAVGDLWRFVLGIDLVSEIHCGSRPVDDTVQLLLTDPRTCHTPAVGDDLWLRLVDVPAALAARAYGNADPVAIAVDDTFLPENSGTYLVSGDGVSRTELPAALVVDVDVLAMMYLGTWRASDLAAAGRIQVIDADALSHADKLFASEQTAWCGTGF